MFTNVSSALYEAYLADFEYVHRGVLILSNLFAFTYTNRAQHLCQSVMYSQTSPKCTDILKRHRGCIYV